MANTTKKSYKVAALITYVIALLCLLAGLLVPLKGTSFDLENMLLLQLPDALNKALAPFVALNLELGNAFILSFTLKIGSLGTIDFGAWLVLLYALIVVIGIICLIPAIIGSKKKRTAMNVAFAIEALAIIVLGIITFLQLIHYAYPALDMGNGLDKWFYGTTIALGGSILMAIIQRIICDKGSGVIKTITFLLSGVVVFVTLFIVGGLVKQLSQPIDDLANQLKMSDGLYTADGTVVTGWDQIQNLFSFRLSYFKNLSDDIKIKVLDISVLVLAVIACINLFLDAIGIAKKTNKFMLVCNWIKYLIALIAAIIILIVALVLKYTLGVMLILVLIILVIQLVITIIRTALYNKAKKASKQSKYYEVETEDESGAEVEPEPEADVKEELVSYAAPYAEPVPVTDVHEAEAAPVATEVHEEVHETAEPVAHEEIHETAAPAPVYTHEEEVPAHSSYYDASPIYRGPTDAFIDKLSNSEKISFYEVFIERKTGKLSVIPEYRPGGDNTKFFSYAMIYYTRFRNDIPDSLMSKIYHECKLV